jgi:glycosyltransferase involved in cell wall biosynthesis
VQFHILACEGPDAYARVGGLATRVEGLSRTLAALGHDTHLWFVGDPDAPAEEEWEGVHLHRWCQSVSRRHPAGVYDGDREKQAELAASLSPYLVRKVLLPHFAAGGRAVVLAEEWQTAHALLHLHWLLHYAGARKRVRLLWNANNWFGFERVPWPQICRVATVTTVSRYMKQIVAGNGVEAVVVPNGLSSEAFETLDSSAVQALRRQLPQRTILAKIGRWDPDKRWLEAVETVGETKRLGWRPLLIARHGSEVLAPAAARGLRVIERSAKAEGRAGLLAALTAVGDADVVNLSEHVDPDARRVLLRGADAVLANSRHEPFGLVGLETMASGGLACTGNTGEDYVVPGHNALVLETGDPREFTTLFARLRERPDEIRAIRRAGKATAQRFAWSEVVARVLFPRVDLAREHDVGETDDAGLATRATIQLDGAKPLTHAGIRAERFDGESHAPPPVGKPVGRGSG